MSRYVERVWNLPPRRRAEAIELAEALGVSPIVGEVLLNRGITEIKAARNWMAADRVPLPAASGLTGLNAAVERLHAARDRGETVLVFGDYDVDGVSATALMVRALKRFGIAVVHGAVPEREVDGYGIGPDTVARAAESGTGVIVTVDNGIAAHAAADAARELGVAFIVTDHHELGESLPDCVACVNPKRDGADNPYYNICGAAVAWLLASELLDDADDLLGYVALGTVADVMPLHGVNRALTARGLDRLRRADHAGLNALAAVTRTDLPALKASDIAFRFGPRLNAAGRMGNAAAALDLMLSESYEDAVSLARLLESANQDRKAIEQCIYEEAVQRAADAADRPCVVLSSPDWSRGIIGIVAARLSERFSKPVVLLCEGDDGIAYGSARSPAGLNLVDAIAPAAKHTLRYGGHAGAAGMAVALDALDAFEQALCESISAFDVDMPAPALDIDAVVAFSEISWTLLDDMARVEPCGSGNPEPLFCTSGVTLPRGSIREYRGGHLGCACEHDGVLYRAVGFSMGGRIPALLEHDGAFDIAYRAVPNEWRGATSIQLQLLDLRPAGEGVPLAENEGHTEAI